MQRRLLFLKPVVTILVLLTIPSSLSCKTPRLAIVFVIDQFAHHYLEKIEPYLSGGIKRMLKNGVVYNNAYMPNAYPGTAPGHTAIGTGTFAKSHGVIGNGWLDKSGIFKKYERLDIDKKYKVFSSTGLYDIAKAASNIMVEGISDQFVLHSRPSRKHQAFALSYKSRASIGTAGKLGKAVWFDKKGRRFTSSQAYFENLPTWIKDFNKKYLAEEVPKTLVWSLFHKNNPLPYSFYDTKNYNFTGNKYSMIGTPLGQIAAQGRSKGEYGELYIKTPHANQHLLDLAKACLDANLTNGEEDRFLLWVSLSPLDPLGHYYGPYSRETIDMIYHIDWQIKQFMKEVEKMVDQEDILYLLTSDHGVMPIVEILKDKGILNTSRTNQYKLTKELNEHIEKEHNEKNVVKTYINPHFYFDKKIFNEFSPEKQRAIIKSTKSFLEKQPAIERVWSYEELEGTSFQDDSIDCWFANQLYPGRSGDIICKCRPYCSITKHETGTNHKTPYEYNTHVPLMLYQKKKFEKKSIDTKVFSTQIANTLAKIFGIAKPSASTVEPLPGLYTP